MLSPSRPAVSNQEKTRSHPIAPAASKSPFASNRLTMLVFLLSHFLLSSCGSSTKAPEESQILAQAKASWTSPLMEQVLLLTNQERQRATRPCRALILNEKLTRAATAHTQDMIDRDYFAHEHPSDPSTRLDQRLERQNYRYSTAGENIAYGYPTPQAVVDGWMRSPGHRANILNCEYSEIGIAMVAKVLPSGRTNPYWTQIFARPL